MNLAIFFFFNSTTNIGKISVISMRHWIKEIIKNKIRESHHKALFENRVCRDRKEYLS